MAVTSSRLPRRIWSIVLLALVVSACSATATTNGTLEAAELPADEPTRGAVETEPTAAPSNETPDETAEDSQAVPAPTESSASPEPADGTANSPARFWSDVLTTGDCVINPDDDAVPTPMSCDELHGEEVFAAGSLGYAPGDPYPGDSALTELAEEVLCSPAAREFGGTVIELLPFTTRARVPTQRQWDAGDRGILCTAAPPAGHLLKLGTAAGGQVDSTDVLLGRGGFSSDSLGEFTEWVLIEEGDRFDAVRVVTGGSFELARSAAASTSESFYFAAAPGSESELWHYDWNDGNYTSLGALLPGWELAEPQVTDSTVIVAARQAGGDWDLFAGGLGSGELAPLADGPGNQRFPALVPDGSAIVFHDDGGLSVIDVDGRNRRELVAPDGDSVDFESSVSPDGSTVAFSSNRSGNDDIWVVPIAGGEPRNLTNHPANDAWPSWSADGNLLYFQTDRLRPEAEIPSLMVMNRDGSGQSWFSGATVGQPVPIDRVLAGDVLATGPTVEDLYAYELVEGLEGQLVDWTHSSGRLTARLPAGWRVRELDDGLGFIASPTPTRFFDSWEADGVVVTLYEDATPDEFFARLDQTAAALGCVDETDANSPAGPTDLDDGLFADQRPYRCGDLGATAWVSGRYDADDGVGFVAENQFVDTDTDRIGRAALDITIN